MKLSRYLRPEAIRLQLRTRVELEDGEGPHSQQVVRRVQESVLEEMVELFDATGKVGNSRKLHADLLQRERKAPTAIGEEVALPHVRTLQAKEFIMAFGRAPQGLPFGAPDGNYVKLFFAMVSPPYDDKTYLKIYPQLGRLLLDEERRQILYDAVDPSEVLRALELF